jgi:hypothetical protein
VKLPCESGDGRAGRGNGAGSGVLEWDDDAVVEEVVVVDEEGGGEIPEGRLEADDEDDELR